MKRYIAPELELVEVKTEDIIMVSNQENDRDKYELPDMPIGKN